MTKRDALAVMLACPIGTHIDLQDLKFSKLHRADANVGTFRNAHAKKVGTPLADGRGMNL